MLDEAGRMLSPFVSSQTPCGSGPRPGLRRPIHRSFSSRRSSQKYAYVLRSRVSYDPEYPVRYPAAALGRGALLSRPARRLGADAGADAAARRQHDRNLCALGLARAAAGRAGPGGREPPAARPTQLRAAVRPAGLPRDPQARPFCGRWAAGRRAPALAVARAPRDPRAAPRWPALAPRRQRRAARLWPAPGLPGGGAELDRRFLGRGARAATAGRPRRRPTDRQRDTRWQGRMGVSARAGRRQRPRPTLQARL